MQMRDNINPFLIDLKPFKNKQKIEKIECAHFEYIEQETSYV